jgi:hypothetical protein
MALPDSYTLKPNSIPAYFDAILDAQPPERFSLKFLENLGFTSTNDRLFIGILKDLGFLNRDGAPQQRYFDFLDRSQSQRVLAEGIREAFADLFAINTKANDFSVDDARNKLRTLYAGKKTDLVIGNIAKTFKALVEYADFTGAPTKPASAEAPTASKEVAPPAGKPPAPTAGGAAATPATGPDSPRHLKPLNVAGLQYHVNIVLPESRDQSVYDAIFRSLREHLG